MRTLLLSLSLVGCSKDLTDPDPTEPQDDTIVDVAEAAGDFETLLTALDAADLTETLRSEGPFTVFAPTDAAFAALPAGTLDALLADVPALTDVLLYHVVGGEFDAAAVTSESLLTTLQGADVKVVVDGGVVTVGGALVTMTDVQASNGVIHVIDAVLIPPDPIGTFVSNAPDFTTLAAALEAADLAVTLDGDGPFTVFAPTDAAFAALPAGTLDALLLDIPALTDVLLYHVVAGRLPAEDVVSASAVTTLQGTDAAIVVAGGVVTVDGATVTATDIPAGNGLVHVVDAVLLP